MTKINLGTVAVQCPSCGGTQLSQGDTPQTEDIGTCASCGKQFSLKAEVDKIGKAASQAIADAIRKALK